MSPICSHVRSPSTIMLMSGWSPIGLVGWTGSIGLCRSLVICCIHLLHLVCPSTRSHSQFLRAQYLAGACVLHLSTFAL